MNKMRAAKGEAGYITAERIRRGLITILLFLIPLTAFLIAYRVTGTRQNVVTIIAMVGCIPACMSAVSLIMVYTVRSIPEETYRRISEKCGSLTMAYDLYMTNYDKNTLFDAIAICGATAVGLVTYKKPDLNDAKRHVENVLRLDGFHVNMTILTDVNAFAERLVSMNEHAESLREGHPRREDTRYPEETFEEQVRHILLQVSL